MALGNRAVGAEIDSKAGVNVETGALWLPVLDALGPDCCWQAAERWLASARASAEDRRPSARKGSVVFAKRCAIVLAFALVTGCHQFHVESQADPSVDFAKHKTYSFSNTASDVPPGFSTGHLFNSIMQRRIRAELYRELTAKGFSQAARGDASFIISFSTGSAEDVNAVRSGPDDKTEPGTIEGSATAVTRGALVIHFIDPKTKKVLWQGSVEAVMKAGEDLDDKVRAAVREVMKQFPPKAS